MQKVSIKLNYVFFENDELLKNVIKSGIKSAIVLKYNLTANQSTIKS